LRLKNGFINLKPLEEKLSEITIVITPDLDFYDFIPVSLINYGYTKLTPYVLDSILSQARNLPPVFQERINSKPEVYEPLRELGNKYLEKNKIEQYQDSFMSEEAFKA